MIQIKVSDAEKNIVAENSGQEEVNLTLRREYQEGDTIIFEIGGETGHYWMQVDDVLGKSLVYLTGDQVYEIPFEEKTISWLVLKDLIKADDPSPFPALTQIEVFGIEC